MAKRVEYVRTAIAAVLIVAAALALEARAPATVAERVRTAMLAQEPGWQLEDSAVEDQRFWHEWQNRAERISIEYTEHPSDADASAWLQAVPGELAVGGEEPLTGVGDEALMWARLSSSTRFAAEDRCALRRVSEAGLDNSSSRVTPKSSARCTFGTRSHRLALPAWTRCL